VAGAPRCVHSWLVMAPPTRRRWWPVTRLLPSTRNGTEAFY